MSATTPSAFAGLLTEQLPHTGLKFSHLTVSDVIFNHVKIMTRVKHFCLFPLASRGGAQETTVRGSESTHCFDGLDPDTLYNATVYTQTPNLEGPGVSVKERTCKTTLGH